MDSLPARRPSRAVIIANPAAGTITAAQVTELTDQCRRWVDDVVVRWTAEPGDATELAGKSLSDNWSTTVVLAVGGDGTAREVVHGLASKGWRYATEPQRTQSSGRTAMFIVPAGSSNSCYRSFWGELPWQDALDQALSAPSARTRTLDLARLAENGKLVLAGACSGFPPQAIHAAEDITDVQGHTRYQKALIELATRYEPYPGRVVVDGVKVHSGLTMLANVGGSRYRGARFEVLPHSVIDDGLLDVCVVGGEHDPADMLALARSGEHLTRSGVVYARGRKVTIERTDGRALWFEHDGEVLLDFANRFTLDVVPHAVPMLVGEDADLGRRHRAA